MRSHPSGLYRQRGLALVELAVALPLLLLLLLGVAEMGRALYQYNTLVKAVRDGARHLTSDAYATDGQTLDPIAVSQMENLIRYGNTTGQGALLWDKSPSIETRTSSDSTGHYITIRARYNFAFVNGNPLSNLLRGLDGGSLPLSVSLTMRAQ